MPAGGRWELAHVLRVGSPDVHLLWARTTVTYMAKTANFDSQVC